MHFYLPLTDLSLIYSTYIHTYCTLLVHSSSRHCYYVVFYYDILCVSFDTLGFRHAMTMAFAINEINRNSDLLPNVTLGYSLSDNCGALVVGFSSALSLASGREEQFHLEENCLGTPPVLAIVGDSPSTFSIATSNVLGLYRMPIVSVLSSVFGIALLLYHLLVNTSEICFAFAWIST